MVITYIYYAMITIQEAHTIAADFINQLNAREPVNIDFEINFKVAVGDMMEFTFCYYFDYKYVKLNGQEYELAGAPGFIVSKTDGDAKTISHYELWELKRKEQSMDELCQLLKDIRENKEGLHIIKSRYNLTSQQILLFHKALQTAFIERTTASNILNEILQQIKPGQPAVEL